MVRSVTGVILAGGSSRRMGTDKSFLDLGGRAVVEWVVGVFEKAFGRVMIITNEPEKYARFGIETRPDVVPDIGTLGGIHAGLFYLEDRAAFFAGSDMPFIEEKLVEHVARVRGDFDAAVPYVKGEYEPLLSVYGKGCLGAVEKKIAAGRRRAVSFFSDINVRLVNQDEVKSLDPKLLSFFNINTPADYRRAQRIAEEWDR
jgi:molybdopterin-guanine dinucleotide biosynthesis protein A